MSDEVQKLKNMIRELLGWATTSCCSDCTPFRTAPSCINWIHDKDCAHLKSINKALALLGMEPDEGHSYEDPVGEMKQLAQQRLDDWNNGKNNNS
jgi:hypothetical protein